MKDLPIFTALADPIRRQLLIDLARNSPKTATEFAREYPITRQAILKHLQILKDARLIDVHQVGREKRYVLTPEPLDDLREWVENLNALWDQRLFRLKTFIESEDQAQDAEAS